MGRGWDTKEFPHAGRQGMKRKGGEAFERTAAVIHEEFFFQFCLNGF